MTRQSRIFLAILLLLGGAFGAVILDGTLGRPPRQLDRVVTLTRLPGAALAVHYFEPRLRDYADYSTVIHPELSPPSVQDFVYEQ